MAFVHITRFRIVPGRLDALVASYQQEGVPAMDRLDGFLGAVILLDRQSGAGRTVSYWDSAENMRASEQVGDELRSRATSTGLEVEEVDRFESIVRTRSQPPIARSFVRVMDVMVPVDRVDNVASIVRESTPTISSQPGFRALLMGANRETGHVLVTSVWDTAANREASDAVIREQQNQTWQKANARSLRTELFESVNLGLKQAALA